VQDTIHTEALKRHSPLDGRYQLKVDERHRLAAFLLSERGLSSRKIAERIGLSRAAVSRILREPAPDPVAARALADHEVREFAAEHGEAPGHVFGPEQVEETPTP
jgi:predicted transcriptional regulator